MNALKSKRTGLRGTEDTIFDLVGAGTTTEQWAEWLRVPLEHAVAAGNLDLVAKLLEAGASGSALHLALRGGQGGFARDLLLLGLVAFSQEEDENGDTPLHLAADLGHDDVLPLLLRRSGAVDALDSEGCTPLHLAAKRGSVSAAKALLTAGAHVNLPGGEGESSALSLAASNGHVDVMAALIQHRADLDTEDVDGCTALHHAAAENQVGAIETLIAAGANIDVENDEENDALVVAFCFRQYTSVIALLKHGANSNQTDKNGHPLLLTAVCRRNLPVVEALLAAGVDVGVAYQGTGRMAVHLAARAYPDILSVLLQHGADAGSEDSARLTALHYAALNDVAPSIELLVDAGANIEAQNVKGETPLHIASSFCRCSAMHALLRSGANVHAVDINEHSPLHLAVGGYDFANRVKAVDMLLRWGADETGTDAHGRVAAEIWEEIMETAIFVDEDAISVQRLLAKAPQDRAWRRRSWLVLCRSRPSRVQLKAGSGEATVEDKARHVGTRADSADVGSAGGGSGIARRPDVGTTASRGRGPVGGLSRLVATVVSLREDGLFRSILEFL